LERNHLSPFCWGPYFIQVVTVVSGELSACQVAIKEMGMKLENSKMKLKKPRPSQQKTPQNLIVSFFVESDFAEGANESLLKLKEARITTYTNQIGVLSQVQ